MADWKVVGQLGSIRKKDQYYMVNIAENKYKLNEENPNENQYPNEKDSTIWFNCICPYKPRANVGDRVVAEGVFVPSKNENFPFSLKIKHIGVILKDDKEEKEID